jgi:hypothetical protein
VRGEPAGAALIASGLAKFDANLRSDVAKKYASFRDSQTANLSHAQPLAIEKRCRQWMTSSGSGPRTRRRSLPTTLLWSPEAPRAWRLPRQTLGGPTTTAPEVRAMAWLLRRS